MKAILDATGYSPDVASLAERRPTPLIPVANKPMVHHVIEFLVEKGVTDIHLVCSHLPEQLREALGNGERWGANLTYHLTREADTFFQAVVAICAGGEKDVILTGRADELPKFDPAALAEKLQGETTAVPVARRIGNESDSSDRWEWGGWSVVRGDRVTAGIMDAMRSIGGDGGGENEPVAKSEISLSSRDPEAILASTGAVLSGAFDGLQAPGSEPERGVVLGRNVTIHPTARILAPVCIGDHSRVGPGVTVGPRSAVGDNCILEERSIVEESEIFPGSFVGEGLEIRRSIVDRNLLINTTVGATVALTDQFLLGTVSTRSPVEVLQSLFSRATAAVLLVIALPTIAILGALLKLERRGAPVFHRKSCVRTPTEPDESSWRTFDRLGFAADGAAKGGPFTRLVAALGLNDLPALVNVARGEMRFVGIEPRTMNEMRDLPNDWRRTILAVKGGVRTLTSRLHGNKPTADERYASELYYGATAGWRTDLEVFFGIGFPKGTPDE